MDLRRFIEEKWVRNGKICHFWAIPVNWYRYPKLVPVPIKVVLVPIDSEGLVPVSIKVVPVALIFAYFALLSPVFVHR